MTEWSSKPGLSVWKAVPKVITEHLRSLFWWLSSLSPWWFVSLTPARTRNNSASQLTVLLFITSFTLRMIAEIFWTPNLSFSLPIIFILSSVTSTSYWTSFKFLSPFQIKHKFYHFNHSLALSTPTRKYQ